MIQTKKIQKRIHKIRKKIPQLQNVDIRLVCGTGRTTMTCRPSLLSLVSESVIPFHTVPKKARRGIIAHELCHIIDYESKSLREIIKLGLLYLTESGKKSFEKRIDQLTIRHGFKKELYAWATYSMNNGKVTEKYRQYKQKYYLHPGEIKKY